MSRKIKFRIWNTDLNSFYYTDLSDVGETRDGFPIFGYASNITGENTLQQFTGLVDKNGKEIYEGDIVCWGDLNYEVFWRGYKWDARCPYYNKYHWPYFDHEFITCCQNSVVRGNIFENPELLEK